MLDFRFAHQSRVCCGFFADNIKALYRRAKANVGAWNPDDARRDLKRVIELDQSLANAARKELKNIDALEKEKLDSDRALLQGKIFG
jgi:AH receptor-interacting protein